MCISKRVGQSWFTHVIGIWDDLKKVLGRSDSYRIQKTQSFSILYQLYVKTFDIDYILVILVI